MRQHWSLVASLFVGLSACGGSEDISTTEPAPNEAQVAVLTLKAPEAVSGTSKIQLRWQADPSLQTFSVWLTPSETEDFREIAAGVNGNEAVVERGASWQIDYPTARIRVRGCSASATCVDSNELALLDVLMAGVTRLENGVTPLLSGDGKTLLQGSQVYVRDNTGRWGLEASLSQAAALPGDAFADTWALSEDGNTVVAAYREAVAASLERAGALVIYHRDPQRQWSQQAVIQAAAPAVGDFLGTRVAVSADGSFVAASGTRRVHLFARDAQNAWHSDHVIQCTCSASGSYIDPHVGLAMSANAQAIAVTTYRGALVPGQQGRDFYSVRVFVPGGQGGRWLQQADLHSDYWPYVPSPTLRVLPDRFGSDGMAFDRAGTLLAIGASARAANHDPAHFPGAIYLFKSVAGGWQRAAQINNAQAQISQLPGAANDAFGAGLALSGNGKVLAASACGYYAPLPGLRRNHPPGWRGTENTNVAGSVNGLCPYGASTYVYAQQDDQSWVFTTAINPLDAPAGDLFPHIVSAPALSADGETLALTFYSEVATQSVTVVY